MTKLLGGSEQIPNRKLYREHRRVLCIQQTSKFSLNQPIFKSIQNRFTKTEDHYKT